MAWQTTLIDLIDGTPLRRAEVSPQPVKTTQRRTQNDRMRELRTKRAEWRAEAEATADALPSASIMDGNL